jgi:hypothetical protein
MRPDRCNTMGPTCGPGSHVPRAEVSRWTHAHHVFTAKSFCYRRSIIIAAPTWQLGFKPWWPLLNPRTACRRPQHSLCVRNSFARLRRGALRQRPTAEPRPPHGHCPALRRVLRAKPHPSPTLPPIKRGTLLSTRHSSSADRHWCHHRRACSFAFFHSNPSTTRPHLHLTAVHRAGQYHTLPRSFLEWKPRRLRCPCLTTGSPEASPTSSPPPIEPWWASRPP